MQQAEYYYYLPIFVGHPFNATYTTALRATIEAVCFEMNESGQTEAARKFFWDPDFLDDVPAQSTALHEAIQNAIRQAALCIFDISQSNDNVFFETGLAFGLNRRVILAAQYPYNPPSDLKGIPGIEYRDMRDLQHKLTAVLHNRLNELKAPPGEGQAVIHQKMQIDSNWQMRLEQLEGKSIYFFAGDVSWADEHEHRIQAACEQGATVRVCCHPPARAGRQQENIEKLIRAGAEVRTYTKADDPRIRGFIYKPDELDQAEVMLTEKLTRQTRSIEYRRTGVTVGESQFFYKATLYRVRDDLRSVTAFIHLFENLWEKSQPYASA